MTKLALTHTDIEDCLPESITALDDGGLRVSAQMLHDFAHAIAAKLRTNLAANPEVQRGMAQGYRFSDLARRYGGKFHGPNVEHLSMPETDFHQMMAEFEQVSRARLPHPSLLIQPERIECSVPFRELPRKLERAAQRLADGLREVYPTAPAPAATPAPVEAPRVIDRSKLPEVTHF